MLNIDSMKLILNVSGRKIKLKTATHRATATKQELI